MRYKLNCKITYVMNIGVENAFHILVFPKSLMLEKRVTSIERIIIFHLIFFWLGNKNLFDH
jgi:hypothetical protein